MVRGVAWPMSATRAPGVYTSAARMRQPRRVTHVKISISATGNLDYGVSPTKKSHPRIYDYDGRREMLILMDAPGQARGRCNSRACCFVGTCPGVGKFSYLARKIFHSLVTLLGNYRPSQGRDPLITISRSPRMERDRLSCLSPAHLTSLRSTEKFKDTFLRVLHRTSHWKRAEKPKGGIRSPMAYPLVMIWTYGGACDLL